MIVTERFIRCEAEYSRERLQFQKFLELNKKEVKPMFAKIIEPAEFSWSYQCGNCICWGGSPDSDGGNCILWGGSPGASYFDVLFIA